MKNNNKKVETESNSTEEKEYTFSDFAIAEDELDRLEREAGTRKDSFFVKFIDKLADRNQDRKKHYVNRTVYIVLVILTGIIGGHRFYERRFFLGLLNLVCTLVAGAAALGLVYEDLIVAVWISIMMSFVDWMIVVPMKADEKGNIWI